MKLKPDDDLRKILTAKFEHEFTELLPLKVEEVLINIKRRRDDIEPDATVIIEFPFTIAGFDFINDHTD